MGVNEIKRHSRYDNSFDINLLCAEKLFEIDYYYQTRFSDLVRRVSSIDLPYQVSNWIERS